MRIRYLIATTGLMLLLGVGCGRSTKTAAANVIPIKVYRVLSSFDSANSPDFNVGCQLTKAEIRTLVEQLQGDAPYIYGSKVQVAWPDDAVIDIVDFDLNDRYSRASALFFAFLNIYSQQYSSPGLVNIYFTGNYIPLNDPTFDPFTDMIFGTTLDPHSVQGNGSNIPPLSIPGAIMINDGAGPGGTGGDWVTASMRATLEHELGHYLGRFDFTTAGISRFNAATLTGNTYGTGAQSRTFAASSGEHITSTFSHLMLDGQLVPQGVSRPTILPGVEVGLYLNTAQGAEKGEVSRKLLLGDYNDWRK